jgi:phosphotransferase system HPr (HPr) family protein
MGGPGSHGGVVKQTPVPRLQREFVVEHGAGLHARPAAMFIRTANRFVSQIHLVNLSLGRPEANAKSILEVLNAAVERGHRIRITVEGEDAQAALSALGRLIENDFAGSPATSE